MTKVRIWDLPTRLFHWLLVLCVAGLVFSGQSGGNAMVWHFRLGYAVLTLLLFRAVWGVVGGHWSRWRQLPLQLSAVRAYLRQGSGHVGHNPLGSWSVLAMLLCLLLQVSTGLVSDDEIANAGPLTAWVSGEVVSAATSWHQGPGKLILLGLVLLHVCAIVGYRIRKNEHLLPAMVHGDKHWPVPVTPSQDAWPQRTLAAGVLLLCALAVRWLVHWAV